MCTFPACMAGGYGGKGSGLFAIFSFLIYDFFDGLTFLKSKIVNHKSKIILVLSLVRMRTLSISQWGIGFVAVVLLVVSSNLNGGKEHWRRIIKSDGKGYYAHLPAVFIYHDFNFGFFDSLDRVKYYDEPNFYDYRVPYKNKVINKYYVGTAVAQLPFFMAAHGLTKFTGGDADGYSKYYALAVNLAAVFWFLLALVYIDKTLFLYDVPPLNRLMVLLCAAFGAHAFYYALVEPAMSHIYSMAFVAGFVYFAKRYFMEGRPQLLPLLGLLLGMVVLIRPINGLVVLACPFLAGDFDTLRRSIRSIFRKPGWALGGLLLFAAVLGIQLLEYKAAVGEFFIYSYGKEGFDFAHPHICDILFSYKKGLFLYTPLLPVSLLGLWFLRKESMFQVWTWLVFFAVITYVLSSWWMWYYGGSFSGRVYVEYIPLFMIPLGIALRDLPLGWTRRSYVLLLFLLVLLCQLQTYQYRYYIIHWADMTEERYWEVFLRFK